ncbi:MAG: 3-isopropylmalate/(R)-2-methylmalate dehydratase small subunit [Zhongshania aliphaticivorans]|jgi:3-isopropylmalate/(R)-2-methylmalate dehydratase small subunit
MSSDPIKHVIGKGVSVAGDDIDTDRIIPARYMKCITFDGLGEYLFYDVRKTESGEDKKHNLNDPRFSEASIIVTGNNFGCGSSREHAPQSIFRAGYRAVIAESFAEIFFGNSTNLGMICACVSQNDRELLADAIESNPNIEITIDLENEQVRFGEKSVPFEIKAGARESLLNGTYDPLDELLEGAVEVDEVIKTLAYIN